jgi:hypothetical protein
MLILLVLEENGAKPGKLLRIVPGNLYVPGPTVEYSGWGTSRSTRDRN